MTPKTMLAGGRYVSVILIAAMIWAWVPAARTVQAATLDLQVSSNTDDAVQQYGATPPTTWGTVEVSSSMEKILNYTPYSWGWLGMRFNNVVIPQGATITNAYFSHYTRDVAVNNGWNKIDATINGELSVNAAAFTTAAYDISGRAKTSATATWTELGMSAGWHNSPSLNAVVQEVVNQSGWVSGNSLALVMQTRSTAASFALSTYISGAAYAPKLHIEYAVGPADTEAPTVPAGLSATPVSLSQIDLSWASSSDNVGVAGYNIYRDGALLTSVPGTTYQDTGLSSGTTYTYTVSASDGAGNSSAQSAPVSATTLTPDTTAPIISSVSASAITTSGATITWLTDEASDSQIEYGTSPAYGSSTTLNPLMVADHSASLSNLPANTLYHYRVKSRDASGNLAISGDNTFTTLTPPPSGTITLDPSVRYQTMDGWEAADFALQSYPAYPQFADSLFPKLANELGINRIRLEVSAGAENSTDYWQAVNKQADDPLWRCYLYATVNDNADPNVINWAGFYWTQFDENVERIILPLKVQVEARGERLQINLNYVAFWDHISGPGCPSGLDYIHDDSPDEYAEFMLATTLHLRDKYNITPDFWEVMLEPDNVTNWNWGGYIGPRVAALAAKLAANGYTPKFVVPSTTHAANAVPYFDSIIQTAGVLPYIDTLSYHRYTGLTTDIQGIAAKAQQYGIKTAMLEHIDSGYAHLHEDLKVGNNSSWQQYALANFGGPTSGDIYYWVDPNDPTSVNMTDNSKYFNRYFLHIRNGAQRIEAATGNANFDPVAFLNTDGKYAVVVKASSGGSFAIQGLPAGTYGIEYTTGNIGSAIMGSNADQDVSAGQNLITNIPNAGVIAIFAKTGGALPDTTPPTIPQNLVSTGISTSTIDLSWDVSSDPESGVNHYLVYRDGLSVGQSSTPIFADAGLTPNTAYSYEVSAVNGEGLESTRSSALVVTTSPLPNSAPVSDAGLDQFVTEGSVVTLDGSGSSDPENDPLTYLWTLESEPQGSTATLSDPTAVNPTFTADIAGTYSISLVVNDGQATSTPDVITVTATAVPVPPTQGLAAYWAMDDGSGTTAADSSGNSNTGILFNGPTWVAGKVNGGLSFDGTNDYVSVAHSNLLTLTDAGTIALWANEIASTPSRAGLVIKTDSRNGYWFTNYEESGAGVARLTLKKDRLDANYDSPQGYLIDGEWHHYVVTWDSSSGVQWYRDGVLLKTDVWLHGAGANTALLEIGSRVDKRKYFKGLLDDIRVFDRALSTGDVGNLYDSTLIP